MQRMNIWASMFCMGNKNNVKATDLFKLYFDDDNDEQKPPITEEEAAELQAMMEEMNQKVRHEEK